MARSYYSGNVNYCGGDVRFATGVTLQQGPCIQCFFVCVHLEKYRVSVDKLKVLD